MITVLLHRLYHYIKYLLTAKSIHYIHSPLLYKFAIECLNKDNYYYYFDKLNNIRQTLLHANDEIEYENIGANSFRLKRTAKIKDILKTAVSPKKYSELHFRIALFVKSRTTLELGTSLGLNTMYLAYSSKKVISIEGQKKLYEFAGQLLQKNKVENVKLIYSDFDSVLPDLLSNNQFDLALIDGNHTYGATIRYYNQLKSSHIIIIIDDIYWNKEMTQAWKEIVNSPDNKYTIDLYRCGIVIFNENIMHQEHFVLRY
ncbi:MAG: class I SAM-dependent methyltransferase [Bacteroidetes bacterium]|nr:MAG: class I SAM-dependent methyltransferase [Bacteroidota bacterium]